MRKVRTQTSGCGCNKKKTARNVNRKVNTKDTKVEKKNKKIFI